MVHHRPVPTEVVQSFGYQTGVQGALQQLDCSTVSKPIPFGLLSRKVLCIPPCKMDVGDSPSGHAWRGSSLNKLNH